MALCLYIICKCFALIASHKPGVMTKLSSRQQTRLLSRLLKVNWKSHLLKHSIDPGQDLKHCYLLADIKKASNFLIQAENGKIQYLRINPKPTFSPLNMPAAKNILFLGQWEKFIVTIDFESVKIRTVDNETICKFELPICQGQVEHMECYSYPKVAHICGNQLYVKVDKKFKLEKLRREDGLSSYGLRTDDISEGSPSYTLKMPDKDDGNDLSFNNEVWTLMRINLAEAINPQMSIKTKTTLNNAAVVQIVNRGIVAFAAAVDNESKVYSINELGELFHDDKKVCEKMIFDGEVYIGSIAATTKYVVVAAIFTFDGRDFDTRFLYSAQFNQYLSDIYRDAPENKYHISIVRMICALDTTFNLIMDNTGLMSLDMIVKNSFCRVINQVRLNEQARSPFYLSFKQKYISHRSICVIFSGSKHKLYRLFLKLA